MADSFDMHGMVIGSWTVTHLSDIKLSDALLPEASLSTLCFYLRR